MKNTADNNIDEEFIDDVEVADDEVEGFEETEPVVVEEPVDKTKIFSQRLKEEKLKIEQNVQKEKDQLAQMKGFDDWKTFEKAIHDDAILDLGVEDVDKFQKIVQKMIEENPEVIKAREVNEKYETEQQDKYLNEQVEEIKKLDPSIKSVEDILALENYPKILEKVEAGIPLYDAFVVCTFKKLAKQPVNEQEGKSHLKTVKGSGTFDVVVPEEVMAIYHKNFKGWSDEKIRESYAKQMKGEK